MCVHIETVFKVIIDSFIAVLYPSPCLKLSLKVNLKNDDFCPVSIHCVSSFFTFIICPVYLNNLNHVHCIVNHCV